MCLLVVELLCIMEVSEVLMVCEDLKLLCCAFKEVVPLIQCMSEGVHTQGYCHSTLSGQFTARCTRVRGRCGGVAAVVMSSAHKNLRLSLELDGLTLTLVSRRCLATVLNHLAAFKFCKR